MKKIFISWFLIVLALVFFICSCSDSNEELLTGKYWVKYKKSKPNYLVKFTENGQYVNFNKLSVNTKYQIIQNRIIFTDRLGEKERYFIKSLTNHELKLSIISDIGETDIDYFRAASARDHFLGSWSNLDKSSHYEIEFLADGAAKVQNEVEGYIAKKVVRYSLKNSNIIIYDGNEYEYAFSDDIMDLKLTKKDGNQLNLTRKK